jgi:Ca2+-transporting ATPase
MLIGGAWSMLINLGLFAWALSSGRSAEEAMTMTFVTLVLIEFFKAYNFRSERVSAFYRPLANRWLNLAVLWELLLLMVIVYVPFMQVPFATFSLTFEDWGVIIALALTITPVLEATKWVVRRRESGRD